MINIGKFYTRKTKGYSHLWFMPLGIPKGGGSEYMLVYNDKIGTVKIASENPRWITAQDRENRLEQPDINSLEPEM